MSTAVADQRAARPTSIPTFTVDPAASAASTRRSTTSRAGRTSTSRCMPTDRVLDALHKIKWEQDGSLTFRALVRARHLRLGCDAHQRPEPARLQDPDQGPRHHAADLRRGDQGAPAREGPHRRHGAVLRLVPRDQPFLIASSKPRARSACRRPAERERFDDTTKCILCAACTSSCPVFWTDGQYFGPAAIVNAHRFIFDSRDEGAKDRLDILNDKRRRVAVPHHLQLHRGVPARH